MDAAYGIHLRVPIAATGTHRAHRQARQYHEIVRLFGVAP